MQQTRTGQKAVAPGVHVSGRCTPCRWGLAVEIRLPGSSVVHQGGRVGQAGTRDECSCRVTPVAPSWPGSSVGSRPSASVRGPRPGRGGVILLLRLGLRKNLVWQTVCLHPMGFLCTCARCVCSHAEESPEATWQLRKAKRVFARGEGCVGSLFLSVGSPLHAASGVPRVQDAVLFSNGVARCCLLTPPGT